MRNNLKSVLGLVISVLLAGFSTGISATIDPVKTVRDMSPGWNLGNTLDAIPTEGSWNNRPARETTIEDLQKARFKTLRIPVTWTHHMGPAPDYKGIKWSPPGYRQLMVLGTTFWAH